MIHSVLKKGNPLLRQPSLEIKDITQAQSLINHLWDTLFAIQKLYTFKRGSGIAAPQIGELWRANAVEYAGQQYTLINPSIIWHSDEQKPIREGCLSFFNYRGNALRYEAVTIQATDRDGKQFTIDANGDFASLLQHELDHLDGELYNNHLAPNEHIYILTYL
jgi:peptide deformylase